ncbi:hypothetical protein TBLA_0B03380 [Henningerozyma blattae CBS 6284]|uniref:Uncharacterized protein n=1 Tax=Henningerozyma blattae (strain ATCC 34711 / CBS 6284 / DSM 70876 / NBRC 10599 / NRRL Y-10934 / UCD 77-7) TaxID=1071380 RepID=I2GYH7_HENB6|nr:hypothetical protein TBLA_0B03380 [Tetrapisispora blattae CBS 6284]CCH59179.1 hypothetical protein TBLA_0B03380 [Tetrapisispora blattae CBS 6284]
MKILTTPLQRQYTGLIVSELLLLFLTGINYTSYYESNPVFITVMIDSILFAFSDTLAQLIAVEQKKLNAKKNKKKSFENIGEKYEPVSRTSSFDYYRSLTFIIWGILMAYLQLVWYEYLRSKFQDNYFMIVLADQAIFVPISLAGMLVYVNYIQDFGDLKLLISKFKNLFVYTLICNYIVWPVIQYCNFKYIPDYLQVPFGCAIGVVWNCFICIIQH